MTRDKGAVGKSGFYVVVYNKGGQQKVGVLEETLMSAKEAREGVRRLREANRVSAAGAAHAPPTGAKASGTTRGILHGLRKASPSTWGDVQPDVKPPAKAVGDTLTGASGGRDEVSTMGDFFGDLKLEGLDAAQMISLGGVTDEILTAHMEILDDNEVSDSGEDTVGEDSDDEESFSGKWTHNPAAPEFKSGSRIVYLGQERDEMH
jgi:hypothetical protein